MKMEVFVFDLDFTLWNAGDTFCSETSPPYYWKAGQLLDQSGRWIRLYPETLSVLELLRKKRKIIVVASRTFQPEWAIDLLHIFTINQYFDLIEIFPGSKKAHLKSIMEKVNFHSNQIVFFDDEERNIADVNSIGIKSILVRGGIKEENIVRFL